IFGAGSRARMALPQRRDRVRPGGARPSADGAPSGVRRSYPTAERGSAAPLRRACSVARGYWSRCSVFRMASYLIAAAGLAEAAWALTMLLMMGGLALVSGMAVVGLALRSRPTTLASVALFCLFTLCFQPWHCFAPFEPGAYEDPDVVGAAEDFRNV